MKPILFSTEMVQAILDGRKTQTRRVVKPQPESINNETPIPMTEFLDNLKSLKKKGLTDIKHGTGGQVFPKCPYGKIGDVLWVRETYLWVMRDHAHELLEGSRDGNQWMYRATTHDDWFEYAKKKYGYKWKPSIHMPKEACRLFLRITNVRVERLQDISAADATAEGVEIFKTDTGYRMPTPAANINVRVKSPISAFQSLWQSINGIESWNANPWVWVIEFERIEKP